MKKIPKAMMSSLIMVILVNLAILLTYFLLNKNIWVIVGIESAVTLLGYFTLRFFDR